MKSDVGCNPTKTECMKTMGLLTNIKLNVHLIICSNNFKRKYLHGRHFVVANVIKNWFSLHLKPSVA